MKWKISSKYLLKYFQKARSKNLCKQEKLQRQLLYKQFERKWQNARFFYFFSWNYRAPQNTPQINTTKPNWTLFCCPSVVKRRATIDNWNEWKQKKIFFSKLVQLMFLLKRTVYSWDTVLVNVKNPSKVNNSRIFYQYNLECPLSNMPVAFYFVSKTQPFFWNLRPKSSCYWPPRSCFWENWQNLRVKLETSLGRTLSDGTFWVLYTAQSRTIWYGLLRPREDCPA